MTSPIAGGGSEHVSRYRALGEFDNLVRAAREARRALKELREEEAKLNAQSLADDKKITASKQARAKAEKDSLDSAKRAVNDLGRNTTAAGRAGEDAGVSYIRGMGRAIQQSTQSGENKRFIENAANALRAAFANAGTSSGEGFRRNFGASVGRNPNSFVRDSGFQAALRNMRDNAGVAGQDTGNRYVMGFASKIRDLNNILPSLGLDSLDLDVDIEDAQESMRTLEFELRRLSNQTAEPRVRIDSTRALTNLRAIQKLFKDEVAEDMVKNSIRIQKELQKIDELPSGKSFKFWTLTALADMSRVFSEAQRGTSVFQRLRLAIAASSNDTRGGFFRTLMTSFDDLSETSSRLLQRLGRVSGELYRMPGVIAVLVSSLPALIAGLGALVGGAGALASGLGALSGFLAAGPGLFAALGIGVAATASIFGGFSEALKAAKKAQEAEAEAKEMARLGTEKALTPQQKYVALLSQLGPATAKVTEEFVKFGDQYNNMSQATDERFFSQIVDDMDALNKTLPILQKLLGDSAEAIGDLTSRGLNMVTSGPWRRDFAIIAEENAANITNMGEAGLSLANVFRNITVAAAPFTRWVTGSLREGARAFADWSAQARSDGTINEFLAETQESGTILWQIFKNLGNVINSFFQTTVDEGQRYMVILQGITARWADVMQAQEAANSPLRQWINDIRPLLSSMGDLIKAVAVGIAGLASDQRNITTMIDLLNTLRTDVLPAILDILQHLNDSGIAVTVARALGEMLQAIATFLDSGATQALTVFVTVLAEFFTLLFNIASLPGVSHVLGGVASALAALAAVSIVARFTGLFKLWDFFTWMTRNRGNLTGAFTDAARGAAGLQTAGAAVSTGVPSTVAAGVGGIGSEVIAQQTQATNNLARAQSNAAASTGRFASALRTLRSGASAASGAIASAAAALGPWGLAIGAATIALTYFMTQAAEQQARVDTLKAALGGLSDKYTELSRTGEQAGSAADDAFREIVRNNPELQETVIMLDKLGVSFEDMVAASTGGNPAEVIAAIDKEIRRLDEEMRSPGNFFQVFDNEKRQDKIDELYAAKDAFLANAKALGITTEATKLLNAQEARHNALQNSFANFIGPVSIGQRQALAEAYDSNAAKIDALQGLVSVLGNAESKAADKADALRKVIDNQTGAAQRSIETSETWRQTIFDLRDSFNASSRSLSAKTREGLRNRDALQLAAKATRELYLQDIASGMPMDQATERHRKRIKELEKEARKGYDNKEEIKKLIKVYGDVPENVKTDLETTGYVKVYQQMQDLKALQASLQSGKSLKEAQREVEQNKAQSAAKGWGDGYGMAPGFKAGGPVWGQGTRTSDSIRAWLSNGEFVQPTDAVEYYGMPIMEALRTRKLDKAALNEALPDDNMVNFNKGGPAHSDHCPSCASGGHKFAKGGAVWPFPVDASHSLIKKSWANVGVGNLGQGSGSGGVAWMMGVLRKQFPGLPLISGYRPGSTTLSGNRSYHSLNRAVDLPPRRDVAAWIRANYGARTKELITPFNDLNLHNGRPHRYTGAIWNQHNFAGGNAHDHWAYNRGGMVDLAKMLNLDNLAPQQNTSLPTTPRTLSPAASSVVNNTTESGTNFGDVIINNPQQERAGDSVRNALFRTMHLI